MAKIRGKLWPGVNTMDKSPRAAILAGISEELTALGLPTGEINGIYLTIDFTTSTDRELLGIAITYAHQILQLESFSAMQVTLAHKGRRPHNNWVGRRHNQTICRYQWDIVDPSSLEELIKTANHAYSCYVYERPGCWFNGKCLLHRI